MRIALVAMSGVRACDEELMRLGLTLPGFVERSEIVASLPSLGLLTLAAMTPTKHEIHYVEIPELATTRFKPAGFDLVAVSSYSAQIAEAYELADRCRQEKVPVVIGGPHVTALPDEAAEHCDAVVIGEGEPSWQQVLVDAESRKLSQRYGDCKSDFDLGQTPVPAFDLLDISKYNRLTVQTSRGCPRRCEFCAASVLLTEKYKQKPIANVLGEVDEVLRIWKRPFIELADDNSFVDKEYWKELLPQLLDRHVKWFTETDLSISEDDELLRLLQRSGCAQVLVGLESPVEAGLAGLELHGDWKLRKLPEYREAIERIQSSGVTVNGCFVIGLDGHTPEIFDQVFEFVRETGLYEVQITVPTPFPGTPFYRRLKEQGRLLYPNEWQRCTLFDVSFQPDGMSHEELADGFRKLAVRLYSEEFTRRRRANFYKYLRALSKGKGATS